MPVVDLDLGESTFVTSEAGIRFNTNTTVQFATDQAELIPKSDFIYLLQEYDLWCHRSPSIKLSLCFSFSRALTWHSEPHQDFQQFMMQLIQYAELWHQLGYEFRPREGWSSDQSSHPCSFAVHGDLIEATSRSFINIEKPHDADLTNVHCPTTVPTYTILSINMEWYFFTCEQIHVAMRSNDATTHRCRMIEQNTVVNATDAGLRNIIGSPAGHQGLPKCVGERNKIGLIRLMPSTFKLSLASRVSQQMMLVDPISRVLSKFSRKCSAAVLGKHVTIQQSDSTEVTEAAQTISRHLWMTMVNSLSDKEPSFQLGSLIHSNTSRPKRYFTRTARSKCITGNPLLENDKTNITRVRYSETSSQLPNLETVTKTQICADLASGDSGSPERHRISSNGDDQGSEWQWDFRMGDIHSGFDINTDRLGTLFDEWEQWPMISSPIPDLDLTAAHANQLAFSSCVQLDHVDDLFAFANVNAFELQAIKQDESMNHDLLAELEEDQDIQYPHNVATVTSDYIVSDRADPSWVVADMDLGQKLQEIVLPRPTSEHGESDLDLAIMRDTSQRFGDSAFRGGLDGLKWPERCADFADCLLS